MHNAFLEGVAWCIWIRDGYEPDGCWWPLTHMIRRTRSDAIQAWKDAMEVPDWRGQNWRTYHARGVVKAARVLVTPEDPRSDFPVPPMPF